MRIIDRYIASNFLKGVVIVLAILLPLFGFLMLSEELEQVGKGAFTSIDALIVVGYSLPRLMLDLLPVTALLGVLIGLGSMANNRELIIINAFGYSAWRTAWPLVKVAAGVILIVLLLQFFAMPKLELHAGLLRSKVTSQSTMVGNDNEFWTRSGDQFIRIGELTRNGSGMSDVEIFELGRNGALQELVQAAAADVLSDGQWLLEDVTITDFSAAEVREEHVKRKRWQSFLSAQQTSALVVPVEAMAPSNLYRYIKMLEKNNLDTHRFRVIFWQRLGVPIGLLAMSLLGLPFLIGSVRSVSAGQRAAIGGGVGILFYLSEQLTGQLATLYQLPPAPAALVPDVLLLTLALVILHKVD